MSTFQRTNSALAILDDGLRLYRRGFWRFMGVVASAGLPLVAVIIGLILLSLWVPSEIVSFGVLLFYLFFGIVMLVIAALLARTALLLVRGEAASLGQIFAIGPLNLLGAGCGGTIAVAVFGTLSSIVSCFCMVPLFSTGFIAAFGSAGSAGDGGFFGGALAVLGGVLVVIFAVLLYASLLVLNLGSYLAAIYVILPFVEQGQRSGTAIGQGVRLLGYRLGENLLTFACAALCGTALAIVMGGAIGTLIPLPLFWLLGPESPVALVVASTLWLVGIVLVLPLPPIWVALLYEQHLRTRRGGDLGERIAALEGQTRSA